MPKTRPPLHAFLYHGNENLSAVHALRARLVRDGVIVVLTADLDHRLPWESTLRDAVQKSGVVIICLSKGATQTGVLDDINLVSGLAAMKPLGDLSMIPVRLESCDVPDVLKRWQPVDLFGTAGYERLMQALKLRADRLEAALEPRADWRLPLQWEDEEDIPEEETTPSKITPLSIGIVVIAVMFLMFWFARGIFPFASRTDVPVDVMEQNLTRNAMQQALNRSMTQTAVMNLVRAPLTQTAAAIQTLQNPATPTLQFPTIIALPTEIVVPGNVTMVYVPGDNFIIGSDGIDASAKPAQAVYVNPFYIDKYEVTNALYRVCVDAGGCEPPANVSSETHPGYYGNIEFSNHPMVNVSWFMANQYCKWRGARLPAEAEWEKAARYVDGRNYPWGGELSCDFANYQDTGGFCMGDLTAVGSYEKGRSFYGVFDMAGNASEWVNSLFWAYPYNPSDGRENTTTTGLRVVRGGSWASRPAEVTTYFRFGLDPSANNQETGFRCAQTAR